MFSVRLGLAAVAAAAIAAYAMSASWSKPEVAFTASAPPPPPRLDLRPHTSAILVSLPVDLSGVGALIIEVWGKAAITSSWA